MAVQADALEVILRVIGVNTFKAQLGEARASVAGLAASTKEADAAMASGGKSAKGAATTAVLLRKASLGVAASMGIAALEGYKMRTEFNKQMTLIETQAGARAKDMKGLTKAALDIGPAVGKSPIEVAKAMYHMQSVFQDATKAVHGTRVAAMGAAIGNSDLEATTSALAAAMRVAIAGGGNFEQTMATLNATIGAGNMRMDDLVLAFGTAGFLPAAKNAGLTLQDVGGALALLTDEGQHADSAATHLRMAFTLMSASSKIAQKTLRGIGIDANQLGATLHGPDGLVNGLILIRKQLEKKFPTFGPALANVTNEHDAVALAERFNTISRAFGGARSSATIFQLMNNIDMLNAKTGFITKRGGVGQFMKAWREWSSTDSAKIHKALGKLQKDLILVGDTIHKQVTAVIVFAVGAADLAVRHFGLLFKVLLGLVGLWILMKTYAGAYWAITKLIIASKFIKYWYDLAKAEGVATTMMFAFDLAMDANPVGLLIIALAALAAIIAILIWKWKDISHWVMRHKTLVIILAGVLLGPFAAAIVWVITHWGQFKHAATDALHATIGAAKWFWSQLKKYVIDPIRWIIKHADVRVHIHAPGLPHIGLPGFLKRPHFQTGGVTPFPMGLINDGAAGESVWVPGGSSIQPSPAESLRVPRAHVPNPAPAGDTPIIVDNHLKLYIDGKDVRFAYTKETARRRARE